MYLKSELCKPLMIGWLITFSEFHMVKHEIDEKIFYERIFYRLDNVTCQLAQADFMKKKINKSSFKFKKKLFL